MSTVLATMVPIFGLVLIGFFAVKAGILDGAGVRGLVLFVFTFAIPALLLRGLAHLELPERIEWGFLVAFYAGSLAAYGLGMAVGKLAFDEPPPSQAIYGMVGSYSNLVMMGLPIVLAALGPEASLWLFLIIAFHSATFMPLTIVLLQRGAAPGGVARAHASSAFAEVLRNPIVLGILGGIAINLTGLPVPAGVDALLAFLEGAAIPSALFALGGSLAGYPLRGSLSPAVALSAMKLVVHPLLVWLVAGPLMGLEGLPVAVAILLAGMPSAVNAYLFGARYGVSAEVAARTVLVTSVASAGTISALVWLLTR